MGRDMGKKILFRTEKICKSFGPTKALVDVDITLLNGEVHGLVGENGSGKSTLSSIIAGMQKADSGSMALHDNSYRPGSVPEAMRMGVSMVAQEEGTFSSVNVAANLFVGRESKFSKLGILNIKKMYQATKDALEEIGVKDVYEKSFVSSLNFESCKLLELARALNSKPELLIIDETSAALGKDGRTILYESMRQLKKMGHSILFIAHDIEELIEMSDRITILRDGVKVITLNKEDFSADKIKELMIGRPVSSYYYLNGTDKVSREVAALEVSDLHYMKIQDLSFKLYKGEILGIGGLSDCGMHEVGRLIFGIVPPDLGTIKSANGVEIKSPMDAIRSKIAYMSKDRDNESLAKTMSIKDNICIVSIKKIKKQGYITKKNERNFVRKWADPLDIKMNNIDQFVMQLSGGNKQKVVLAKWMGFEPDIYIMDCPTRGIDVGVKAAIYEIIEMLKKKGKAILIISEELPELIGMCDRVLIMNHGKLSGEFLREEQLSEHLLINCMI